MKRLQNRLQAILKTNKETPVCWTFPEVHNEKNHDLQKKQPNTIWLIVSGVHTQKTFRIEIAYLFYAKEPLKPFI